MYDNAVREAQGQTKSEVNYSKYDNNKDGSVSYQNDSATQNYVNNTINSFVTS